MKGVPCGSQAVTDVGGTPQSEKPVTACGIRCLKRRPGHLKEGPPGLRNSTPFRHTWVLTIAPVSGREVRGGTAWSLHHGEALQGWVIPPQWSRTESPGTEERGRQPLRPTGDAPRERGQVCEGTHRANYPAVLSGLGKEQQTKQKGILGLKHRHN